MKKTVLIAAALLTISVFSNKTFAQAAAPASSGDVVTTLSSSDYTVLGMLFKVGGLSSTLSDAGPYTVFAPANDAFFKLSSAKADSLGKDQAKLAALLKYHVVSGKLTKADIIKALTTGKGKTTLKTIDGQTLTLSVASGKLQLADERGNTAQVTTFDIPASNGVIHGISAVLDK